MRRFAHTTGRLIAHFNAMCANETPAQREQRIAAIDLSGFDAARTETVNAAPAFASIYDRMMKPAAPRTPRRNSILV